MTHTDAILVRLERLEQDLLRERRRGRGWRFVAIAAGAWLLLAPRPTDAAKKAASLDLQSPDGRAEARFTAEGFEYRLDGQSRVKFDVGDQWDRLTFYRSGGSPSMSLGTDDGIASLRLFSPDEKVRVELSENTLGLGAGMRLFDETGKSRAALFSGHAGQATGLRITDDDFQPRVEISSEPGGEALIRATDSGAQSVVEISVLHESDATARMLGFVPTLEHDPLVPMVYLLDPSGTSNTILASPGP